MNNLSGYDELEFERLSVRLSHQTTNAFFCVIANSPVQSKIAERMRDCFPPGEVQVIDFKSIGNDFRFSCATLRDLLREDARFLLLLNFQLACGDFKDEEFLQTLNFCRDGLAELPYVFVFMMPLYFRKKIARNAPDFNSFFQYKAYFKADDAPQTLTKETNALNEYYSAANKNLLEYYIERYDQLKDYENKQAFEVVLKILELNISVRVLYYAELNRFFSEFIKLLPKYENELDNAAYEIARIFQSQGKYDEALAWYGKDLEINEKALGKNHPNTATTYNNIANVYYRQGEYDKALLLYEKALNIYEKVLGKDHPHTAHTYNNIATVYCDQGQYDKALMWHEKARVIREKVLGKDHPDTAAIYNNMANVYYDQGEYEKALMWHEKARVIREKVLGKDHPDTATTYNDIANVYYSQGEYDDALLLYEKALNIYEKVLGKDNPDTATTYNNIANVYYSQGEYDKALLLYEKALNIYEKVLGKDNPKTATTYNNIANVYINQGEYDKALLLYEKALNIYVKVLGKNHPDTADTYNNIARVYDRLGKHEEAKRWRKKYNVNSKKT